MQECYLNAFNSEYYKNVTLNSNIISTIYLNMIPLGTIFYLSTDKLNNEIIEKQIGLMIEISLTTFDPYLFSNILLCFEQIFWIILKKMTYFLQLYKNLLKWITFYLFVNGLILF